MSSSYMPNPSKEKPTKKTIRKNSSSPIVGYIVGALKIPF